MPILQKPIMKVNQPSIGIFVLKRNFPPVDFSELKPLRIGPYKILDRLSDVTNELLSFKMALHYNFIETT